MKRKDSKTITVDLPPELHKKLKQIALDKDTTMTAIILTAVKRELAHPETQKREDEKREG